MEGGSLEDIVGNVDQKQSRFFRDLKPTKEGFSRTTTGNIERAPRNHQKEILHALQKEILSDDHLELTLISILSGKMIKEWMDFVNWCVELRAFFYEFV